MPLNKKLVGIEIGGTKLQLVTGNSSGVIEDRLRLSVDQNAGAEWIRKKIKEELPRLPGFTSAVAIGVGFGGPVNTKSGTVAISHQVEGWAYFPFKEWLQHITGKTVEIDNDANVAALAEAFFGKGKGKSRVFYMTIGSGIGGGLVIDGNIYHGRIPGESEVGHLLLDKNGNTLESQCSGWAVNRKVREYIDMNPKSFLGQLASQHPVPEAQLLFMALEQKDKEAIRIMNLIADDLAFGLSHVVHLFHPDILIIGGGLSLLGDHLREPVYQQLHNYVMKAFHPLPPVEIAGLGEDVVPVGAMALAANSGKN